MTPGTPPPELQAIAAHIAEPAIAEFVASLLDDVCLDGWADFRFPHMSNADQTSQRQATATLKMIAENQTDPAMARETGQWMENEFANGNGPSAAKRLTEALKTKTVRTDEKRHQVFHSVADFIRKNREWPARSMINIDGISPRTRDAAFEEIARAFGVKIDGRERWIDPL